MKYLTKFLKILGVSLTLVLLPFSLFFGHLDLPLKDLKQNMQMRVRHFSYWDGHYRDEVIKMIVFPSLLIHGTAASLHTYDAWTSTLKALIA
jgi:hypothetical protein